MKAKNLIVKIVCSVILLAIGFGIGWASRNYPMPSIGFVRENSPSNKFTSPLLFVQIPENVSEQEYGPLKKTISNYILDVPKQGATRISVYFRDLNSNLWFGINATDTYSPASMLKVANLIAFLRVAEKNPKLLSSEARIAPESADQVGEQDYYPPKNPVKIGQYYPTQELLEKMITESDNNAAETIRILAGKDALEETYSDLRIYSASSTNELISPITYSRFFRSLYNASYLSHDVSEETLELLSRTTFDQGLVAGVPKGTVVAHKFGERTDQGADGKTEHELHDCGIVYFPGHPYFLCVMTKSTAPFPTLQKIIAGVSEITWNDVSKMYAK